MQVVVADTDKRYQDALAVRSIVFIKEQHVTLAEEIDEYEQEAVHFVAYADGQAIGAGRVRFLGESTKIERICVLKSWRGKKAGNSLMKKAEELAADHGSLQLVLHAQIHAVPFYQKLGYVVTSEPFLDAGILHVQMEKQLSVS